MRSRDFFVNAWGQKTYKPAAVIGNALTPIGGGVAVIADADHSATAIAEATAFGALLGGNAALANADVNGTVDASIGDNVTIFATGDVQVQGLSSGSAFADADGEALGGLVAIGGALANASISGTAAGRIDSSATIDAGGVEVRAGTQTGAVNTADAITRASAGAGFLGLAPALSNALVDIDIDAFIDQQAAVSTTAGLSLLDGDVRVIGDAAHRADALTEAAAIGGLLGAAAGIATADILATVDAVIATATINAGGSVQVRAASSGDATATGDGKTAGALGVGGALASATVGGTITAHIDSAVANGADVRAAGDVAVLADGDHF